TAVVVDENITVTGNRTTDRQRLVPTRSEVGLTRDSHTTVAVDLGEGVLVLQTAELEPDRIRDGNQREIAKRGVMRRPNHAAIGYVHAAGIEIESRDDRTSTNDRNRPVSRKAVGNRRSSRTPDRESRAGGDVN